MLHQVSVNWQIGCLENEVTAIREQFWHIGFFVHYRIGQRFDYLPKVLLTFKGKTNIGIPGEGNMDDRETIARLKALMEQIQSLSQLHASIVDYTYVEIMEAYRQLTPQRQAQLEEICDRDTRRQLTKGTQLPENPAIFADREPYA